MKFRKGDVVMIEATIASAPFNMDNGDAKVKIEFPPFHDAFVDPADLTMKRPNIAVGDRVRCFELAPDPATVLAVTDDFAWVEIGPDHYSTWRISRLERVDPEPAPAEAEAA